MACPSGRAREEEHPSDKRNPCVHCEYTLNEVANFGLCTVFLTGMRIQEKPGNSVEHVDTVTRQNKWTKYLLNI